MNEVSSTQPSQRRYRRRILGWGAVCLLGIFAGGAAIFGNRVEDDLERRVTEVLDGELTGVVTVQFRGQDGTLFCHDGSVEVPAGVLAAARDVWGVHALRVDAGCSSETEPPDDEPSADGEAASPATDPANDPADSAPISTTVDQTAAEIGTVVDVIANDSQFSILEGLIGDAAFNDRLDAAGRFTVFAPTDTAFEVLGPDVVSRLRADPELLAAVLAHHATLGALRSADFVDGPIEMLDGTSVTVEVGSPVVLTSSDAVAVVTESDLLASNGVVHAIDQVLLPGGASVTDVQTPGLTVTLQGGRLVLSGVVATDAQRQTLLTAAATRLDAANVVDELDVDDGATITDSAVTDLAVVVAVMVTNMTEGVVAINDDDVSLTGVYVDAAALGALEAAAGIIDGIVIDLTERPVADSPGADALAADLNRLVQATPIQFDPNSTAISTTSGAVLDQVAARANSIAGVTIEIQGHTDTDGLAATNQRLSEGRAISVVAALVARGVSIDSLTAVGFGGSQPVLDALGVEDKPASRRVEFVVTLQ